MAAKTLRTPARVQLARLAALLALGFDRSEASGAMGLWPRCSQCQVLVINGIACHETGCRNEVHECAGCNAVIAPGVEYCGECAS